jgi:predicted MFS family arabinose efflux permease
VTNDHPATATPPATYAALLRTRGVAAVFGIALTNPLGMTLQIFALSVVVYQQTGSALWSSIAFAAGFLPQVFGGALLTSLADRWSPRALLASGALTRAIPAFVLAVADLPPAVAISTVALVAVWQPVPQAAQSALLTRLVSGQRYVLGRSVLTVIGSGAQLLGLALGGAVVHWLGGPAAFAVAGLVHVVGLLAVLAIPALGVVAEATNPWHPGETWRGNGRLLRDPSIRRILLSWWLAPALLVGAEALVVAYMGERGGSAAPTGLLLATFPAGMAVGDIIVGRFLSARARRRATPWLYALVGAPLLPLILHPGLLGTGLCFTLASAGMAYQLGGQEAFLDAVPEDQRGLGFGLLGTGLMGGQGIGPVLAGSLADTVGAAATMTALGVAILLAAVRYGPVRTVLTAGQGR